MKTNKILKWFKKNYVFILVPLCMILIAVLIQANKSDANVTKDKKDSKDLSITIPKHNEYGIIRIENEEGLVEHTYAGYFKIHNDGTDGSSVSIGMVIPEGGYIEGSEELPSVIRVYDRSNGKIIDYECSPEIKDGALHLYDASVIGMEDVSNLTE